MKIIARNKDFRVEVNTTGTFFVIDHNDDCWKTYRREKAAIKYMNSVAG